MQKSLQARFALYYFFSIGLFAVGVAYIPLFAQARGLSAQEISFLGMALTVAAFLAPPLLQYLSESCIAPRTLCILCATVQGISYTALYWSKTFSIILVCWLLCNICHRCLSVVDARAIRLAAAKKLTFEYIRIFGSIGFVSITFCIGFCNELIGVEASIFVGSLAILLLLCSFLSIKNEFPKTIQGIKKESRQSLNTVALLSYGTFGVLLLFNVLIWAVHAPFFLYFSLYLADLGQSSHIISLAWMLSVIAEITLFAVLPRVAHTTTGYIAFLFLASGGATLRWLLLGSYSHIYIILASQLLHAFSYGSLYLASMKLTHLILPEAYKDRGQGVLVACGNGFGYLIGQYYFGQRVNALTSYATLPEIFMEACYISLLGIPLLLLFLLLILRAKKVS